MLLSPGHSPRRLPTPSPEPSRCINENPTSIPVLEFDLTAAKRSRKAIVLDEESYVASIEKIIERDFFPDIPKLRDRLDWLQAVASRDPVLIRDAQLKIIERRHLRKCGAESGGTSIREASVTPGDGLKEQFDVSMPLDEFLRKYTSEDNESFSRIMGKVNKRRREKYGHLLDCGEPNAGNNLICNGNEREKCATDGYGTSDQPVSTLDGWKYTPKNLLMYYPADRGEFPLTEEERALRLKGSMKEISRTNTRFHGKIPEAGAHKDDDCAAILYTPVVGATPIPTSRRDCDKGRKYDLEDFRKTPNVYYSESDKKANDGYSFVKTPSPAPGIDESPFITWGEIEGTPLRLEKEETPIDIGGSGDGPQFRIPLPPSRDVKAHSLSREAAMKLRERTMMFRKPPLPSPVRGSGSPVTPVFSRAARKFMRKAIAKSSHSIVRSLRESYCSASPGSITPKNGRSMSRLGRDSSQGSDPAW